MLFIRGSLIPTEPSSVAQLVRVILKTGREHTMEERLATGLIGGPEKREITIVEYNTDWIQKFEIHAKLIAEAVGVAALRIEHVGSTSVLGLAAKPIIDILVVVADSSYETAYLRQLEAARYVLRVREPDWHGHRMFRTPERDVHIHIFSAGCQEVARMLSFRDRLRQNPYDRERYERAKRELASKEWADMNAYARAKTDVIEEIIAASQAGGESVDSL
jgi:GrpB-like predicted nucleotidyltransferase (UPF0157 family)